MSATLAHLERRRADLLTQLAELKDLRPGSISTVYRKCGRSYCHCAQPNDPGHGPSVRLTYKVGGRSQLEVLATPAAVRKAEREIAEYRRFRQWSRAFIEVNEKICRHRALQEESASPQEKKRPQRSGKKWRGR